MNEYADTVIGQQISQLPGVAQVQIYGTQKYAVRIRVDPAAAAARGISASDIQNAIEARASNTPIGLLSGPKQALTIDMGAAKADARRIPQAGYPSAMARRSRLDEIATIFRWRGERARRSWFN